MPKLLFLLLSAAVAGCHASKPAATADAPPMTLPPAPNAGVPSSAGPAASAPVLIYKTKADYHDLVPVLLSADRTAIVAYPAPADVVGGQPQALHQGYWLDRRGIGPNVAFLRLTYAQYAALPSAPALADMLTMLVDRDPLVAFCDCGAGGVAPAQLNALIDAGQLGVRCKVLK